MNKRNNGFTILELLVVIAVIGVLTAVVLVTVGNSRSKAKDKAIITEMKQFEILLNLEYNENKSYAKLQAAGFSYITSTTGCNSAFVPPPTGSVYYDQARKICLSILANMPRDSYGAGFVSGTRFPKDKYSLMARLNKGPYTPQTFFCIGSSGTSTGNGSVTNKGCWLNP